MMLVPIHFSLQFCSHLEGSMQCGTVGPVSVAVAFWRFGSPPLFLNRSFKRHCFLSKPLAGQKVFRRPNRPKIDRRIRRPK
jgi:hypothetical protein